MNRFNDANVGENRAKGIVCLALAFLFLLLSLASMNLSTFFIIPLIIWMVFQCDSVFIPALTIGLLCSGYSLYAMEAAAFAVVLLRWRELIKIAPVCKQLLIVYYLSLPLVLFLLARNMTIFGVMNQLSIQFLVAYLPFAFFFWGILCGRTWDTYRSKLLAFAFLSVVIMFLLRPVENDEYSSLNIVFFIIPWGVAAIATWLGSSTRFSMSYLLATGLIILGCFMKGGNTLTIIGATVYAVVIVSIQCFSRAKTLQKVFVSWMVIVVTWGIMGYGMLMYEDLGVLGKEKISYEELQDEFSVGNIIKRFRIKLFDDRSKIWTAGWKDVTEPPFIIPEPIKQATWIELSDGTFIDSGLALHNLYIETLQSGRLFLGGVFIALYICAMGLAAKWFILKEKDVTLMPYAATVMATGFIHAMTANPMNSYPYLLLGFAGIMYGQFLMIRNGGRYRGLQ